MKTKVVRTNSCKMRLLNQAPLQEKRAFEKGRKQDSISLPPSTCANK
jgi:hypothetical protein